MFVVGAMFYGIGLIFVLPFFFHVKGIVYREMFGITLKIVATEDNGSNESGNDSNDDNNDSTPPRNDDKPNKNPEVFDA
jgi:hypothetical protein